MGALAQSVEKAQRGQLDGQVQHTPRSTAPRDSANGKQSRWSISRRPLPESSEAESENPGAR